MIVMMRRLLGEYLSSAREILQLGYKLGFVDDAEVWLLMLRKRNNHPPVTITVSGGWLFLFTNHAMSFMSKNLSFMKRDSADT